MNWSQKHSNTHTQGTVNPRETVSRCWLDGTLEKKIENDWTNERKSMWSAYQVKKICNCYRVALYSVFSIQAMLSLISKHLTEKFRCISFQAVCFLCSRANIELHQKMIAGCVCVSIRIRRRQRSLQKYYRETIICARCCCFLFLFCLTVVLRAPHQGQF